jgi:hypothetical protein
MKFRDFLNQQILNLVKNNRQNISYYQEKQEIFFFQIGCYPEYEKTLDHEYPHFIKQCEEKNLNVNLILIDPHYKNFLENNEVRDRIYNYGKSIYVYDKIINPSEYLTLVEFCHFISNFNCLSVIMEMTGIPRREYYLEEHQKPYLYITPSNCSLNTEKSINCPIFEKENFILDNVHPDVSKVDRFIFERVEKEEDLYEKFDYTKELRLKHIVSKLEERFLEIPDFYLKCLTYMKIKPRDNPNIELNYNKDYSLFNILKKNLYYRLYNYQYQLDRLFIDFMNSNYENLEVFIRKKIFFTLVSCLNYKMRGDLDQIKLHSNQIIFDSLEDIRNILIFFEDLF